MQFAWVLVNRANLSMCLCSKDHTTDPVRLGSTGPSSQAEFPPQLASLGTIRRRPSAALQPSLELLHLNLAHNLRLFHGDSDRRQSRSGLGGSLGM